MRTFITLVALCGLLGFAGCNKTPADRAADRTRDVHNKAADDTRDAANEKAERMRDGTPKDVAGNSKDPVVERNADLVEKQGERKADAIEKEGERKADAIEDRKNP
jgi:hypothetical protein